MPNEMREYENQEMEGNESPVPQEDEERSVEGIQKEQAPAMEEPAAPAVPAQTSAHRSRATQTAARRSSVVAIGAQLQAETEAEKNRNALLDLVESMKSHRVLSGTIQGVERPENSPSRSMAVLYHGDFKVIIPAEEMIDLPEDLHGLPKSEVLFSMVNRRMGAEVDYVVKVWTKSPAWRRPAGWRPWPASAGSITPAPAGTGTISCTKAFAPRPVW